MRGWCELGFWGFGVGMLGCSEVWADCEIFFLVFFFSFVFPFSFKKAHLYSTGEYLGR